MKKRRKLRAEAVRIQRLRDAWNFGVRYRGGGVTTRAEARRALMILADDLKHDRYRVEA